VQPTSGSVLPMIIGLTKNLQKKPMIYCTSVRTGLENSIQRRFADLKQDPHFIISTVLDPRYQFKWTEDPAVKANCTALIIQLMDQQNSQL
jgi:hypothetical protein